MINYATHIYIDATSDLSQDIYNRSRVGNSLGAAAVSI